MQGQARPVYIGRGNDAIVRQFLASRLANCTTAAAASMTTTVKCMCVETGDFTKHAICRYNTNQNLRTWS